MNTTARNSLYAACLLVLVLFPACLDIETTTQVHSDGSILRTTTFEDDSATIYRGLLPIPLDSTWQTTIQKVDKDKFRLTATRLFHTLDEMNEVLKGEYGKTLQSRFVLDRSFQWFFTTYRFAETNPKYVQYDSIPLTDFVSPSEIDAWEKYQVAKIPFATKGDSLAAVSAEPRFKEWESRNVFEPVFSTFLAAVQELHNPRLSVADVAGKKDTLYRASRESLELGKFDTLEVIFTRVLRNQAVHAAVRLKAKEFEEIKRKRDLNFVSGALVSNVVMPGLITGSNAGSVEGNKATWKDYKDFAKILGFTMWVESRQVNWWAVILTGVLIFALLVLMALSMLKRRRYA